MKKHITIRKQTCLLLTVLMLFACVGCKSSNVANDQISDNSNDSLKEKASLTLEDVNRDDFSTVSSDYTTTMVIDAEGTLWGWGSNQYGVLLQNAHIEDVKDPIQLMDNVMSVSVSKNYALVIDNDRTLWGLGDVCNKQTLETYTGEPTKIFEEETPVLSACAGTRYIDVVLEDGTLIEWERKVAPIIEKKLDNVANVSTNGEHTLAVKTDGTLWGWGNNDQRQIGPNALAYRKPAIIMEDVLVAYADYECSYAVKKDGSVWAWGNVPWEKPTESDAVTIETPQKILDDVVTIDANDGNAFFIKNDGSLWGWGYCEQGQLGNGTVIGNCSEDNTFQSTPVKIDDNVLEVDGNGWATFYVKDNGDLYGCGCTLGSMFGNDAISNDIGEIWGVEVPVQTIPVKLMGNINVPGHMSGWYEKPNTINNPITQVAPEKPTDSKNSGAQNSVDEEIYDKVLCSYYTALADGYNVSQLEENGLNYLCSYYSYSEVGYQILDIDGNGVAELLIGEIGEYGGDSGLFFDLYTIINQEPVLVVASSERDRYYLCTDGLIANEGSSSAFESMWAYYKMDTSTAELLLHEAITFDATTGEENYYYTAGAYAPVENISEETANQIINSYEYSSIIFEPIPQF